MYSYLPTYVICDLAVSIRSFGDASHLRLCKSHKNDLAISVLAHNISTGVRIFNLLFRTSTFCGNWKFHLSS